MAIKDSEKPVWYGDGLKFTCTQCGNCCTGPAGYVWFTEAEGRAMAETVGVSERDFYRDYAHQIRTLEGKKWSLNERLAEDGVSLDCVFLTETSEGKRGCSIYESRPRQCRTWPFWPENLESERAYRRAAKTCPGMTAGMGGKGDGEGGGQGKTYSLQQIRVIRDSND